MVIYVKIRVGYEALEKDVMKVTQQDNSITDWDILVKSHLKRGNVIKKLISILMLFAVVVLIFNVFINKDDIHQQWRKQAN